MPHLRSRLVGLDAYFTSGECGLFRRLCSTADRARCAVASRTMANQSRMQTSSSFAPAHHDLPRVAPTCEGRFQLTTFTANDGAAIGENVVTVVKRQSRRGETAVDPSAGNSAALDAAFDRAARQATARFGNSHEIRLAEQQRSEARRESGRKRIRDRAHGLSASRHNAGVRNCRD